jgi:D-serine dehydratase
MTYRSRESQIILGCRINQDPENKVYEEYNLNAKYGDTARSSDPPVLVGYQDRLYVFWKASVGGRPGQIAYVSKYLGGDLVQVVISEFAIYNVCFGRPIRH